MGVLDFAHINIFITVNEKEDLEMEVLGRGRAGHFAILAILYDLLQFYSKNSRANRYLMRFITILFKNSRPNRYLRQFYSKIQDQIVI